jgi:hypothetical protein
MTFTHQSEEFVFKLSDGSIVRESAIPEMDIQELRELLDLVNRQHNDMKIAKQDYLSKMADREAEGLEVEPDRKSSVLRRFNVGMAIQSRLRYLVIAALKEKQEDAYRDERYEALLSEHNRLKKLLSYHKADAAAKARRIQELEQQLCDRSLDHAKRLG